jgi:hypothetical protein
MKYCFYILLLLSFVSSYGQEKKGTIKVVKPITKTNDSISFYSDTIRINDATFEIIIPKEYSSKLFPKILNGRFILIDNSGEPSGTIITSYVLSIMQNGVIRQYFTHNSLYVPMLLAISKNKNFKGTLIVESLEGESLGGVTFKNLIGYFYLEKIR